MRTLGQYMAGSGATFGFVIPEEKEEEEQGRMLTSEIASSWVSAV